MFKSSVWGLIIIQAEDKKDTLYHLTLELTDLRPFWSTSATEWVIKCQVSTRDLNPGSRGRRILLQLCTVPARSNIFCNLRVAIYSSVKIPFAGYYNTILRVCVSVDAENTVYLTMKGRPVSMYRSPNC